MVLYPHAVGPDGSAGRRSARRPAARPLARWAAAATACLLALTGCQLPVDTDATLERVRGGVLRVGVTHNPPWVDATSPTDPTGSEVQLVEAVAADLEAAVEWTVGSEAVLVEALEAGDLDLLAGGFTDDPPWAARAAVTAPYREDRDEAGTTRRRVLLARAGENRFLTVVEQSLADQAVG